jgi:citrate synthase
MNPYSEYLGASEASELLGIKRETLYAYASRGLVQSIPGDQGPTRLYRRADLERLRARKASRRGEPAPVGSALHFGEPLLDSSVSWLGEEGPVYRGHAAVDLAEKDTPFEAVAELLWTGELPDEPLGWRAPEGALPSAELHALLPDEPTLLSCMMVTAAALGAADPGRFDVRPEAVMGRARPLIRTLAASCALGAHPERFELALYGSSIAEAVVIAIGARQNPQTVRVVNRALVLLADHELNASTFAARVVASTHSDLYACVVAGLAALQGPRHGAASEQVAALVAEIGLPERAEAIVHERMRRGELIPGFGHIIYTGPDPRTAPMLEAARSLAPQSRVVRSVGALIDAMRRAGRPPANVDTALVALGGALGVPAGALPAIFGVGRLAGWVAHVLEQYRGGILRPRARYTPARG